MANEIAVLETLANEINKEHFLATETAFSAIEHAKNAGEKLIEAKAKLKHGEWLPWVEKNCVMAERQARRYMQTAENWDAIKSKTVLETDLGIAEALKQITKDKKEKRVAKGTAATVGTPKMAPKNIDKVVKVGRHLLVNADNRDGVAMGYIKDGDPAALCFCDPPYNAGVDDKWDGGGFVWEHDYLLDHAKVVAVTPGIGNIDGFFRATQMEYRWSTSTVIANGMTRGALGFGNWIYTALFAKDKIHKGAQDVSTITIGGKQADGGAKRQKPSGYLSWLFSLLAAEGDTILDPFAGSGSSVIVADALGMSCVAVECDRDTFRQMVANVKEKVK